MEMSHHSIKEVFYEWFRIEEIIARQSKHD